MEKNNSIIASITTVMVIGLLSAVAIYYTYKKHTPLPPAPPAYSNSDTLIVSPALHPYNQCLTIVMNESRKNQEVIKIEKARELCLEMVKGGKDIKK